MFYLILQKMNKTKLNLNQREEFRLCLEESRLLSLKK